MFHFQQSLLGIVCIKFEWERPFSRQPFDDYVGTKTKGMKDWLEMKENSYRENAK